MPSELPDQHKPKPSYHVPHAPIPPTMRSWAMGFISFYSRCVLAVIIGNGLVALLITPIAWSLQMFTTLLIGMLLPALIVSLLRDASRAIIIRIVLGSGVALAIYIRVMGLWN